MSENILDYKVMGSILKSARASAGYSQNDVAQWFGVTYQNVSSWERGASKIDIDSLLVMCQKFGINCARVLQDSSKEKQPTPFSEDGLSEKQRILIEKIKLVDDRQLNALDQIIDSLLHLK